MRVWRRCVSLFGTLRKYSQTTCLKRCCVQIVSPIIAFCTAGGGCSKGFAADAINHANHTNQSAQEGQAKGQAGQALGVEGAFEECKGQEGQEQQGGQSEDTKG